MNLCQGHAQFTTHILCNSSYHCENDLLLCSSSSNCSVECLGDESCSYASINGYYANSLYLTAPGSGAARYASIYCPNNLQNGIVSYFDTHKDRNESVPVSRAVIDCSTQAEYFSSPCYATTFYCSNTHIVKINCCASSTVYAECRYSNFYINNVKEFELNIGKDISCWDCSFYFENMCFLSFSYYDFDYENSYQSDWVFDNIDMIYGNAQFGWRICTNTASETITISSSFVVIDHIIKTLDDLESCTKYASGDITISNYNPFNINTVDIDSIKNNCTKSYY